MGLPTLPSKSALHPEPLPHLQTGDAALYICLVFAAWFFSDSLIQYLGG